MIQQGGQIGIGVVIEDQKTGIDRMADALDRDIDRVGMAAQITAGFIQRDVMPLQDDLMTYAAR